MKKRSKLNLSNFHNCTLKMGQLYPVNLTEVLPGDTVQLSTSVFMRFAPMVAPVMHPTHMFVHSFYVPSRLIANWMSQAVPDNRKIYQGKFDFESFITGGPDGTDSQVIPISQVTESVANASGLLDAFGIPVQNISNGGSFSINSLPLAAYYMIWNDYYRDQDLQEAYYFGVQKSSWKLMDSEQIYGNYPLLQPCWSKDYFTTARPWPQKGPQVTIPIDLSAGSDPSLTFTGQLANGAVGGKPLLSWSGNPDGTILHSGGNPPAGMGLGTSAGMSVTVTGMSGLSVTDKTVTGQVAYNPGSLGTGAISVDDVREAFALQRFEEHRAQYGSRYEDYLRFLGVRPQDARLQMPEYLGGFASPVQFSEVLQTSASEKGGVGDLYGHGIAAARGRRIRRFIPEHGYIMSLMCVRPIPVYAQGIERLWSRETRVDFWQRELEHIGQQEILNKEVYADGTADDGNTFGFQNRYDEYRRGVNVVTGEFRTNQDFWTLSRIFANRPALNSDFVECNPSDRIFQVGEQNSDQVYAMVKNNIIARRLVSKNGNPI